MRTNQEGHNNVLFLVLWGFLLSSTTHSFFIPHTHGIRRSQLPNALVSPSRQLQADVTSNDEKQQQQHVLLLQQLQQLRTTASPAVIISSWEGGITHQAITNPLLKSLFSNGQVPVAHALGVNAILFGLFHRTLLKALTATGFVHAMALGTGLWSSQGWKGWSLGVMYLILGQVVTKVRFSEKKSKGLAEKRGGRRGPENVWGSAATALACALASTRESGHFLTVSRSLYRLGFVASLATKIADTFASEIGKAYGKTCFLITNFQRVEPGTEGAVSLEGTLASLVGGFILSMYGYALGLLTSPTEVAISTIASFVATNIESILGATLQEKKGLEWISNEVINFVNTLIGAVIAIALGKQLI